MNDRDVIAYYLTWTCYGTWLPGDSRGWHDWRHGWQVADPKIEAKNRQSMTEDAVTLNDLQRANVEATIRKHCDIRNWHLWAVNCRTNHVHVVTTARTHSPEQVRDQLKAWCTRNLKTAFNPAKKNWWTEGAYIKQVENEDDLAAAIEYTLNAQ